MNKRKKIIIKERTICFSQLFMLNARQKKVCNYPALTIYEGMKKFEQGCWVELKRALTML